MIKVVFLDIDNTLLSFSGYVKSSMRDGFAKFGLGEYNDGMFDTFERINNGLWKQLERGELTFETLQQIRWNRIFEALNIDFDGVVFEKFFRENLFSNAVPEEGATELLEYLAEKYVLCAASNGPYEQQINRLRVADMHRFFRHFFISSAVGAQKPSREFFDHCFKCLHGDGMTDLRPEESIIIGDSVTSDMAGGHSYGMHTCLYLRGQDKNEELPSAEYRVKELLDIKRIL